MVDVAKSDGSSHIVATGQLDVTDLIIAVYAKTARALGFKSASGALAFDLLLAEAARTTPVIGIVGIWTPSSDNYRSFWEAKGRGLSDADAARATWTGRQAVRHGYSTVVNLDLKDGDRVTLRFIR